MVWALQGKSGPILEEISNEMSNEVTIAKHNIDNEPNTPKSSKLWN